MVGSTREETIQDMDLVLLWGESSAAGSRRPERAGTEVGKGLVLMQEAVLKREAERLSRRGRSRACFLLLPVEMSYLFSNVVTSKLLNLNRILICIYFLCIGTHLSE